MAPETSKFAARFTIDWLMKFPLYLSSGRMRDAGLPRHAAG
jgi:hypothetical protein